MNKKKSSISQFTVIPSANLPVPLQKSKIIKFEKIMKTLPRIKLISNSTIGTDLYVVKQYHKHISLIDF